MKSKSLSPLLFAAVAGLSVATTHAQNSAKPLTQDELLRQIETLSPASSDPGRSSNRAAKPNPALGNVVPLLPEKKEPKAKPEKKAKGPTEIVANEATFDQKAHLAVFIGDVVVTDPEFTVKADKLTAYLKHDDKAADGAKPPADARPARPAGADGLPPQPAGAEKKAGKGGGLERAIAEANAGGIVTVTQEKQELDGSISRSVGHGRKVTYDATTGDITLYGRPDVQQGINSCVSTDDATIMILNRDGKMRVTGAHKTVIKENNIDK